MRRANGSGSIFKMKEGKRRNPWRVRVTKGWEIDPETGKSKQVVVTLGYYHSRAEAEKALADYNKCPYDIGSKDITFEELYKKWFDNYSKILKSVSSERTLTSAYRYCHALYKMKVRDIRSYHLKDCMNDAYIIVESGKNKGEKRLASASTKARMKSLFNLMFDYAYEREVVDKNYARAFHISQDIQEQKESDKRKNHPFTDDEIRCLWGNLHKVAFVDMVLIGIYSGFRPQELACLKIKDIDLEQGVMIGGMKTKAGKDRSVPIHPDIRGLIENRYREATDMESEYLFNDLNGQSGTHMTYDKYRHRFDKVKNALNMGYHHAHETRHTFITKAKESGVDEYLIKRIVGHTTHDVTEKVYTHRKQEDIIEAMKQIKFPAV